VNLRTRLERLEREVDALVPEVEPYQGPSPEDIENIQRFARGEQVLGLEDLEEYRDVIEDLFAGKLGGPENSGESRPR
jgi:hypothetical protein